MNTENYPKTSRRGRGGKRKDLDNLYVRSSWEANYARYLNLLKRTGDILRWEYEPDTFEFEGIKRGSRFYTPDFKVFSGEDSFEYHEVKGHMDAKSATKLRRISKYFSEVKVVLVDKPRYQAIASAVSGIIKNWEAR